MVLSYLRAARVGGPTRSVYGGPYAYRAGLYMREIAVFGAGTLP